MRFTVTLILGVVMISSSVCSAAETRLKDQKATDSYSIGYEFGDTLRKQEIEVDREVLLSAVRDALDGKEPVLRTDELHESLDRVKRTVMIHKDRQARELAAKNLEEGKAFLVANKATEGVKTLASGLQYRIIKQGSGPIPKGTDLVKINYRETLINGTEVENSYGRSEPPVVRIDGMIKGWREALELMKVGSKWQLFVPSELAYGTRENGRMPANSVLIFDLELLSIENYLINRSIKHTTNSEPSGPETTNVNVGKKSP